MFFSLKSSFAHFSASRGDYFSLKVYFSQRINFFGPKNLQSRFLVFNWQHHISRINCTRSADIFWPTTSLTLPTIFWPLIHQEMSSPIFSRPLFLVIAWLKLIIWGHHQLPPEIVLCTLQFRQLTSIDVGDLQSAYISDHFDIRNGLATIKFKDYKDRTFLTKGSSCCFV